MKRSHFPVVLNKRDTVKSVLACIYVVLVFVPLIVMLTHITPASIRNTLASPNFFPALRNSVLAASLTTAITLVLSYLLAYCTQRVQIRGKILIETLFTLPMLVPTVSHGMGLIFLFGNSGFFTKLLGIKSHIYGLPGIILGSVLYAFPVAYLMFADVMKYEDGSQYEAAGILGISRFHQFTQISLPYMKKPIISVTFTVFSLVITDYGVPLMIGGKFNTLPVILYQEVIGGLNFSTGAVCGVPLLIPAFILFLFDALNRDKAKNSFVTHPITQKKTLTAKIFAAVLCSLTGIFMILPILSFIMIGFAEAYPMNLTFTTDHFRRTFQMGTGGYIFTSIVIALCVSAFGVCVSFLTAYMSARMPSKASSLLHLAAITSTAIPGIVLGLSYVLTFKGSFIYDSIGIFIMINMIHFISSPYLMSYNSLTKLNQNLENVGQTLGVPRSRIIIDVLLPMCKNTLVEMFGYFFVNCMTTISAVSFLASGRIKPISLMINQFEAQMQFEAAAVVSLSILLVNFLVKLLIYFFKIRDNSVNKKSKEKKCCVC